jgi:hypothetical protein
MLERHILRLAPVVVATRYRCGEELRSGAYTAVMLG